MAKLTRRAIDKALRENRADGRARKLADGRGLFLFVSPAGGTHWRYRYRIDGRESQITLGSYPEHDLDDARARHVEARRIVLTGGDPAEVRRLERQAAKEATRRAAVATVGELRTIWLASPETAGWAPSHRRAVESRLRTHLEGDPLETTPLAELTPEAVREWLERMQTREVAHPKRGRQSGERLDLSHRLLGYLRRMLDHAVAEDLIESNPARHQKVRLAKRPRQKKHGHTLDRGVIGQLLRAPAYYGGDPAIGYALRLLPRLFCRPGELRLASWHEFDIDGALWRVPGERMKNRLELIVPLAPQVLELLAELREYTTGDDDDPVLPSPRADRRHRPISQGAFAAAYAQLGFGPDTITPHGWRHVASTLLNEGLTIDGVRHTFRRDAIERQLAHVEGGIRAVYNAAEYLPERIEMMRRWADYLDTLERAPVSSDVVRLELGREVSA